MKNFLLLVFIMAVCASTAVFESHAQVFTGGTVSVHLDTNGYFIDVAPMLGLRLGTVEAGVSPFFNYRERKERSSRYTYGGRLFTQVSLTDNYFLHGEYEARNVESFSTTPEGKRKWINGLPVGAGYRYNLTRNTRAYGMVLYDVMRDDDSPGDNPILRGGLTHYF